MGDLTKWLLVGLAAAVTIAAAAWILAHSPLLPEGVPPSLQATCGKLSTFEDRMACVDAASDRARAARGAR